MTPKVVCEPQFSLYVYGERNRHHLPHCHVRRRDGRAETVVSLVSLEVIIGPALTAHERGAIRANQDKLCDEWDKRNT
jgi:hypothetical protein